MIQIQQQEFIKDGKKTIILSGEIHYFRTDPNNWPFLLDKLIETGCNVVASYVPWIIHEEIEGDYDFKGKKHPSHNLKAFIKLAQSKGLMVFLRPGPFIMAEMKNEGIPFWIYEKYPNIRSLGWNLKPNTSAAIDYLNEDFLREVKKWYDAFVSNVKEFFYPNGSVFALQIDNEIGMLQWVTNSPDLNESVLQDFNLMFKSAYTLADLANPVNDTLLIHQQIEHFYKDRYYRYYKALLDYLKIHHKLTELIYFVNIHGTSNGRGLTFPIGISQLIHIYQKTEAIPGTDIYLQNLKPDNFTDLYLLNEYLKLTNPNKPSGSLEFEVGNSNYGDNLNILVTPNAAPLKLRMSFLNGQRFFNYYLFSGGYNRKLEKGGYDGNDRVAFTGERHGFAAPINPELEVSNNYDPLKYTTNLINNMAVKFSDSFKAKSQIKVLFNLDYYATEYSHPNSNQRRDQVSNINLARDLLTDILVKPILLNHYSVEAVFSDSIPEGTKLLLVPTSTYLSEPDQINLVTYLKQGNKAIFIGSIPTQDFSGNKVTILADYLNVTPKEILFDHQVQFMSLKESSLYALAEFRSFYIQTLETPNKPLFKTVHSNETVGFYTENVIYLTSIIPGNLKLVNAFLEHLSVPKELELIGNSTYVIAEITGAREQFIHLINIDFATKNFRIKHYFEDNEITLNAQTGLILPIHQKFDFGEVVYSTCEIFSYTANSLSLNLHSPMNKLKIKTDLEITPDKQLNIEKIEGGYYLTILKDYLVNDLYTIYFKTLT